MRVKKIAKIFGYTLLIVGLLFGGLLFYLQNNIKPIFEKEINKILAVKVEVDQIEVSGFRDFPNLGIVFNGVVIPESTTHYKQHALIAKKLALYIDIKKLWRGVYEVDKIKISDGQLNLADLKNGSNYDVIKSSESTGNEASAVSFEIKKLIISNCILVYKHTPSNFYNKTLISDADVSLKTEGPITLLDVDGAFVATTISYENEKYVADKNLLIQTELVIDTEKEEVKIEPSKIRINEVKLQTQGTVNYTKESWIDLTFSNDETTSQSLLSVLPQSFASSVDHLTIGGNVAIKGSLKGKMHDKHDPSLKLDYTIANSTINGISKGIGLKNINGNGSLTIPSIGNLNSAKAELNIKQAKQKNSSINGRLTVRNFNRPQINWDGKAQIDLPTIVSLSGAENFVNPKGNILVDGILKLTMDLNKDDIVPGSLVFKGNIKGKDIQGNWKDPEIDLKKLNFDMVATTEDMVIRSADFAYNESSGSLKAYIRNFDELGSENSNATIVGDLTVNGLNVNDYYTSGSSDSGEVTSTDLVPIKLLLKTNLTDFHYNDFVAQKITGNLSSDKKQILMKNCAIDALDGNTKADISLRRQGDNFVLDITGNMGKLNIEKMFKQFNNFEQNELTHEHLKGIISGRIHTKVVLDKNYEPILPKVYAKADITIVDGELNNYEPMNELSSFVEIKDLQNVKFKTLSNSIEIFEETIHIPKMRIENNALNLEIEGTHNFDNYMEYKMSLSVAELLATKANWLAKRKEKRIEQNATGGLTAYITMTGTPDDLKIKYDRATAKEKMKEEVGKEKEKFKKALKGEGSLKDDDPKKNYDDDVWDE